MLLGVFEVGGRSEPKGSTPTTPPCKLRTTLSAGNSNYSDAMPDVGDQVLNAINGRKQRLASYYANQPMRLTESAYG